jgi:vacuolar-type H+-ATPase subunit I/STV1
LLGGSVEFELRNNIALDDFNDISSLWSVLVHSGYLTPCCQNSNEYRLPNKEVQSEFASKVVTWVKNRIGTTVHAKIIKAIWSQNTVELKELLDKILMTKISYFDEYEYCYHMLLLGLIAEVDAISNRESGNGRTDLTLKRGGAAAILELKKCYAELYMTADALKGIMQIRDRLYGRELEIKGFNIIHYGISFYKKGCYVILESEITKDLIAKAIGDMEAATLAVRMQIDKRESEEDENVEDFRSHRRKKWYKDRRNELDALADALDKEGTKFNFKRLLANTEALLYDLKWLQKAEAAKMPSQTLLQAMLIQEK